MSYLIEIIMLLFISIIIIKVVTCKNGTIDHYSLYRVTAFNSYERQVLYDLHVEDNNIIFLNGVTNDAALPMDIIVHECCTLTFEMKLQDYSIEYINIDSDWIQEEFNSMNNRSKSGTKTFKRNIAENFLDWDNLTAWVDSSCQNYALLNKTVIGSTYEGRELFVLTLNNGKQKQAVFILGGEQGRDWMSTAVVLNFLRNIIEGPQNDLLKYFNFYFMPVFNPDGYEYTMKHERLWNKNRKAFFPEKKCITNTGEVGVNIDRNWFYTKSQEITNAECMSVYIGNNCLSEEETQSLSFYLNSIASNLLAFINLRGFESLITIPYSDQNQHANNQAILLEMLIYACTKLEKTNNVSYTFSNTASCFFNFSGNVADWVKLQLNVPIVYTMYLRREPYIFPHVEDIITLSNEFTFVANEMLVLGNNIYGPLFSKQPTCDSNMLYVTLFCTSIIFCFGV